MKKLLLISALIIFIQSYAQDYKDKQILKFSDSSKTFIVIDECLVYNTKSNPMNLLKLDLMVSMINTKLH